MCIIHIIIVTLIAVALSSYNLYSHQGVRERERGGEEMHTMYVCMEKNSVVAIYLLSF